MRVCTIHVLLNLFSQTAHTIRNSINPLDHVAAGFITGAFIRTIGGPRAMLGNYILQLFNRGDFSMGKQEFKDTQVICFQIRK